MASLTLSLSMCLLLIISLLLHVSSATRTLKEPVQEQPLLLSYHNGPLLSGRLSVNLVWYGQFKPTQKSIIADFVTSLSSSSPPQSEPTAPYVSTWWSTTEKYYRLASINRRPASIALALGRQISDDTCTLGKRLSADQISQLASRGEQSDAVNVVLTAADVAVDGFCFSRCGTRGTGVGSGSPSRSKAEASRFAYIWVGNSEAQCPGRCAWPFHQPMYGPQAPPLVAPNGDVGVDGMVINLASLLAATATNPFGNGFYQGEADAPLEAASACPGVYGSGSSPGYPGDLLVDTVTGGSYNAQGAAGRNYLLPALYDPTTSSCATLV